MYPNNENLGVLETATDIPSELIVYYNRASKRYSNPIVLMIKDACTSCFTTQPTSAAQKIRLGSFGVCERCGRILYYDKL